jgi:hypothetical protein
LVVNRSPGNAWGWEKKDFRRGEEELKEVQPVPRAAQDGLGAARGTGCTKWGETWPKKIYDIQHRDSGVV